jgi:hypothetical protein
LEVGYVLEVVVDAVEEGGEGGGVDVDVAGGSGDVEEQFVLDGFQRRVR